MRIEIEYADDCLDSMGAWGYAPYRPSLSHSEMSGLTHYHYTHAQKLHGNLINLGRTDRPEWIKNRDIISNSIGHYFFEHIVRIIVHKVTIRGNGLILHVGIAMVDETQFQCGYVLSESLNLHENIYSKNFDDEDSQEEADDNSSITRSSLDLSSISFELPKKSVTKLYIDRDYEIDDLTIEDESISKHPGDNNDIASVSAEDELAAIINKENVDETNQPFEKKFKRAANWQPDIFRPLTPPLVLPDSNKTNAPPDLFQLHPPSYKVNG